ncbi:hypothetical protein [Polyangium jinanense]|uniref:Uncharacterized protein n=1 Tax=Polyangium jinanense TaxID=2829994 RepID=A0A9X3X0T4_9BACT|nr:hypothetical protein [Polyangium jinanense]MDC3955286.1 hypothetical protein [Polyangium jinanense]MDC3981587.1 hypothetical protein [Polyangium jinanense]
MQSQRKFTLSCLLAMGAVGVAACSVAPAPERIEDVGSNELVVAGPGVGVCNQSDPYEKNNKQATATGLNYSWIYFEPANPDYWWSVDTGGAYTGASASICKNDEDWYFVSTSNLPYAPGWLSIRAKAAGASHCPMQVYEEDGETWTSGYDPPAGPENTIQIDVYSAGTLQLVASAQSNIGRIFLDTYNGPLDQDLYLRVHGPKEAHYGYELSVAVQTDAFEDECES